MGVGWLPPTRIRPSRRRIADEWYIRGVSEAVSSSNRSPGAAGAVDDGLHHRRPPQLPSAVPRLAALTIRTSPVDHVPHHPCHQHCLHRPFRSRRGDDHPPTRRQSTNKRLVLQCILKRARRNAGAYQHLPRRSRRITEEAELWKFRGCPPGMAGKVFVILLVRQSNRTARLLAKTKRLPSMLS